MIHEDGIEVYLKPGGSENEDIKFAEFALPDSDYDEKSGEAQVNRCTVLAREGAFSVVVRCSPGFECIALQLYSSKSTMDEHSGIHIEDTSYKDLESTIR